MRGLCLQGGGAKGAFQAGAMKALVEKGYTFDCAVGASVGALNAAMYALGKTDELYELWQELDFSDVMPVENKAYSLRALASVAFDAILNAGVDTTKIRAILAKHVDEEALRRSKIRFGLVTVEGKFRGLKRLFIEDIPQGQVIDYLMASAALPFFKKVEIDGVRYWDGGILDNLPLSMLEEAGYHDIVAIRLGGDIRCEIGTKSMTNVKFIDPSESAGQLMLFDKKALNRSLRLGYCDARRALDGLVGKSYYIEPIDEKTLDRFLRRYPRFIVRALTYLRAETRGFFSKKCRSFNKAFASAVGGSPDRMEEVWIRFAESVAENYEVERLQVYSMESLFAAAWRKRRKGMKAVEDDKSNAFVLSCILCEEMGYE